MNCLNYNADNAGGEPVNNRQTSQMAIAALILGILGFVTCGVTGVIGLILGIIALKQIRLCSGLTGFGLAIGGITVSGVTCLLLLAAIVYMIVFPPRSHYDPKANCLNNQKQIATAIMMFVQDHDETFPLADTWNAELAKDYGATGKVWDCPSTRSRGNDAHPDYGFNTLLSDLPLSNIPDPAETLLTADTYSSHLIAAADNIASKRHEGGFFASFTDGHVVWLKADAPVRLKPTSAGLSPCSKQ